MDRGLEGTFYLHFQDGLNHLIHNDFAAALEAFLLARTKARNTDESMMASMNTLICFESLGLAYRHTLDELNACLERQPRGNEVRELVGEQFAAFQARRLFGEGDLKALSRLKGPEDIWTQFRYYKLWLGNLPYLAGFFSEAELVKASESFALHYRELHNGSYRRRSLQGILHPDDLSNPKVSDIVARIYLWVWRWLVSPDQALVDRVLLILSEFDWPSHSQNLTREDASMLENAILWLGLFGHHGQRDFPGLARIRRTLPGGASQVFDYEKLLIDYCYALRDEQALLASDLESSLKIHPLAAQEGLWLTKMLDSDALPPQLAGLSGKLTDFARQSDAEARYVVDLRKHEISDTKLKDRWVSEAMSVTLVLLYQEGSLECRRLIQHCFGIRSYDPLIHDKKIHNLLYRMKKRFPAGFRIWLKDGSVRSAIDWHAFRFLGEGKRERQLSNHVGWRRILTSLNDPRQPHSKISIKVRSTELVPNKAYTRRELQEKMALPRSTMNRLVATWIKEGLAVKQGKTRTASYQLTNELVSQLTKRH